MGKGIIAGGSGGSSLGEIPQDSYLVGTGTKDLSTKTPEEVREHIGAVSAEDVNTAITQAITNVIGGAY